MCRLSTDRGSLELLQLWGLGQACTCLRKTLAGIEARLEGQFLIEEETWRTPIITMVIIIIIITTTIIIITHLHTGYLQLYT